MRPIRPLAPDRPAPPLPGPSFLRIVADQKPVECGPHRGFRAPDGGYVLVWLPAATERRVEVNECLGSTLLGSGVLIGQVVLLALGIHDIQKIRQAALVALPRQVDRPLTRVDGIAETLETLFLGFKICDRRIR